MNGPAEPMARPVTLAPVGRGAEVVLLVEDDDAVRALAFEVLSELGYDVLAASDGFEALRLQARQHRPIQLLITDVVMPRMNGPDLAKRLLTRIPGLAVLFVSGYASDESWGRAFCSNKGRSCRSLFRRMRLRVKRGKR